MEDCSAVLFFERTVMEYKTNIVIPNYNGIKFLPDCMEALENQSEEDFIITVVDNASKDESLEWLLKWRDNKRKRLIRLPKNQGFSAAVNKGIEYSISCGCKYTILLNNDTKVHKDYLKNLVLEMDKSRDNTFSLSSKMLKMDNPKFIDDAGDAYTLFGWAYQIGLMENAEKYTKKRRIISSCAGAAIYRNSCFKKVGLFDEAHFAYLEDVDISLRAYLYGFKSYFCPSAICLHKGSGTSGSKYNSFKVRLSSRNSIYLIYKNMPLFLILINMPFLLAGILIKQIFFIKKGFGLDYFKGILDAFRNLPSLKTIDFHKIPPTRFLRYEIDLLKATIEYIKIKL